MDTENRHFQKLQAAIGAESEWSRALRVALGQPPAHAGVRVRAGLRLYQETAALLAPQIQPAHRPVIAATLARIETALS